MDLREVLPGATLIAEDLYRSAGDPVDVYIRAVQDYWEVFGALRPAPARKEDQVFRYLLERNGAPGIYPGAFALRDGNVIYRVFCNSVHEVEAACRVVRAKVAVYGPKLLRMT
ncbi:MAG: hypothetical protein AB1445_00900 [Bacillota bacterium]